MHELSSSSRRVFVVSVSLGSAALLGMRNAIAQADAAGGDWFAMVKAQHALVERTFAQMMEGRDRTFLQRDLMRRALSYQLTAHSVAEENVLYPALARSGMLTESDRLYLDQAHAKVLNAELQLVSEKNETAWFDRIHALQTAVMKHAREDEEANFYPKLRKSLDKDMNVLLATAYQREFASVKPTRGVS